MFSIHDEPFKQIVQCVIATWICEQYPQLVSLVNNEDWFWYTTPKSRARQTRSEGVEHLATGHWLECKGWADIFTSTPSAEVSN